MAGRDIQATWLMTTVGGFAGGLARNGSEHGGLSREMISRDTSQYTHKVYIVLHTWYSQWGRSVLARCGPVAAQRVKKGALPHTASRSVPHFNNVLCPSWPQIDSWIERTACAATVSRVDGLGWARGALLLLVVRA